MEDPLKQNSSSLSESSTPTLGRLDQNPNKQETEVTKEKSKQGQKSEKPVPFPRSSKVDLLSENIQTEKVNELPDVDHSQRDIFETEDPPNESVQNNYELINDDKENEEIDKSNVSTKEAFSKFADKDVNFKNNDFSDSVRKKRIKRGGFIPNETEYEIVEKSSVPETMSQKFHRLQNEVQTFLQQLEEKKNEGATKTKVQDSQAMMEELKLLQQQLEKVNSSAQRLLSPNYVLDLETSQQAQLSKKLFQELSNLKQSPPSNQNSSTSASNSKNGTIYELYYLPDSNTTQFGSKLVELEKKVSDLETLVGKDKLVGPTSDVVSVVQQLKTKINLLQSSELDTLQKRMNNLTQELNQLVEKKEINRNIDDKKVDELYELVIKFDSVSEQIPTIVNRLKVLKTLHEESASFQTSIQQLETCASDLKKLIGTNQELLSKVEGNLQSNLNIIQNNFSALEQKIIALNKKVNEISS